MTSEDEYQDAHALAKEAMQASETPQEDVTTEEPVDDTEEAVAEETEESETSPDSQEDSLTEAQLEDTKKFGKLSGDKRVEKIQSMLSSGRADQVEKAKELQEMFDITLDTPETDVDEAVQASLKKAGLDTDTISEMKEKKEIDTQKKSVSVWAKALGVEPDNILKNKTFVKAYHQSGEEDTNKKVDDAIKAYAATRSFPNPEKAEATLNMSTTGKGTEVQVKKQEGFVDMKELLNGKSLEEIDLSTI